MKKPARICICAIPRFDILGKIRIVLAKNWGIKVYGVLIDPRDTVSKYQLMTDQNIAPKELRNLKFYCAGFVAALE